MIQQESIYQGNMDQGLANKCGKHCPTVVEVEPEYDLSPNDVSRRHLIRRSTVSYDRQCPTTDSVLRPTVSYDRQCPTTDSVPRLTSYRVDI